VNRKDLLGLRDVTREEIDEILETASRFREVSRRRIKKVPTLRGRTVVTLFFENSTRTRVSFDLAAKRLSADGVAISASTSSTRKGETLMDTARNIAAMAPDLVILRHSCAGAPHMLARAFPFSVINAGDGINEHPTQALLDMLTMTDHLHSLEGKTVAIVGDVYHSRVARSNIYGLTTMGARVLLAGPGTMCRPEMARAGVEVRHRIDEVLEEADVLMMLRIQRERLPPGMLPSSREYSTFYGLDSKKLARASERVLVMHPGPINRGVEMSPEVADGERSVIMEQVTNGVAVRMALLFLLLGSGDDASA
jgi:aspartate carbamoyltransferase catalytic subunit